MCSYFRDGTLAHPSKTRSQRISNSSSTFSVLCSFPNDFFLILEPEAIIRLVIERDLIWCIIHGVGNSVKSAVSLRNFLHILDETHGNSPLTRREVNADIIQFKSAVSIARIRRAPFPPEFLREVFAGGSLPHPGRHNNQEDSRDPCRGPTLNRFLQTLWNINHLCNFLGTHHHLFSLGVSRLPFRLRGLPRASAAASL